MQEYKIIITPQAQEQITDIAKYIKYELSAPMAMDKFLKLMEDKLASLSVLPERVALTREQPWRSRGVRVLVIDNYLVYFWIDKIRNIVFVIAVIYSHCDQNKILEKIWLN